MTQMLASADDEFTASPAYWAPFFVVGDPRLVDDMVFKDASPDGEMMEIPPPDTVMAKRNGEGQRPWK